MREKYYQLREYIRLPFRLTKKMVALLIGGLFALIAIGAVSLIGISSNLPKLITVADYEPLLVTEATLATENRLANFLESGAY